MNRPTLLSRATDNPDLYEITLIEPSTFNLIATDPYYFKDFVGNGYFKIDINERAIMDFTALKNVARNFGIELDEIVRI